MTEFYVVIGGISKDTDNPYINLQLIPLIDRGQPDFCETCHNTTTEVFWNGRQSICVDCDKNRGIYRKEKKPMVDEGLEFDEFLARIQARTEIYGSIGEYVKSLKYLSMERVCRRVANTICDIHLD